MTSLLRSSASELNLSPDNPRGEIERPALHPLETALVGVTSLHLCFLPWALGTMHVWSQFTSLGLAMTGFILAVMPRTGAKESSGIPRVRPRPETKLWRLPSFLAAVSFFGYVVVQGLNPAWNFSSDENSWWLEPLDFVSWLPSGVNAPFARSNPWRELVIVGSLLLLTGSVWLGFQRRRTYHLLFIALSVNAGLLALFGLVQRLTGATRMFWSYVPSNPKFVASFIYPNHAGSYLYLMAALAAGLAWWHSQRARSRRESSGPAAAFVLIAVCCGLLVVLSYSRMSTLLLLILILTVGGSLLFRMNQRSGPTRYRPELIPVILILVALILIGVVTQQSDRFRERFSEVIANPATAVLDRTLTRQAATDMLRDHWLYGWGAGCFRYGFPKYTKSYPEIHYFPWGTRRSWEHAHNDLLEIPVELGVVGLLPLAVILGSGLWHLFRRRFWRNVVSLSLVVGCTLILLHAWVDFVFQNPAILLTWGVLLVGAGRWAELDQPGGRQTTGPA